ncbi:LacI family DNA-binding transcriptional regulator [Lacisediminihabitans changchengi]|uniref:Substrate-binding domain-containing protein n=1 Tax=Lacisediminihabitans changchengi TaxID=2787634 RepID=A0A934SUV4_9MICO|nr:substrate-binding domain-containing protein [Lacisediminihabitans changchengi]MBK4348464.1 substrate-binding domain-containing protein [Lacisediminihabitans changchengi]
MTAPRAIVLGLVLQRVRQPVSIDPFYSAILTAMEGTLAPSGGRVLTVIVNSLEEELALYQRWVEHGGVDGVVVVDLVSGDPRPAVLGALRLPTVVLGEWDVPPGVDDIRVDNYGAMFVAVRYLVGLGHRVIGRVGGPADLQHTAARTRAFRDAIDEAGATGLVVDADYSVAAGESATAALLASLPDATAIIYDNDLMAVGGERAASAAGIAVPDELSLLAWDDSTPARLADPPLSVLAHDSLSLGVAIASTLVRRIAGERADAPQLPVTRVLERGTTAPSPVPAR